MSQSYKAAVRNPGGTNTEVFVVIEQRPIIVPLAIASNFNLLSAWIVANTPLAALTGGDKPHATSVLAAVGVTLT